MIAGDLNADPSKGRFYRELLAFANDSHLFISDQIVLPHDSYSYISRNESCGTSWLDHFIVNDMNLVQNIEILYGFKCDDHISDSYDFGYLH